MCVHDYAALTGIAHPIYATPDPVRVSRLYESHGAEVVAERWPWVGQHGLQALKKIGDRQRGIAPPVSAEDERVVEAVREHGGIAPAAQALGIDEGAVQRALRRAGVVDYPRAPRKRRPNAPLAKRGIVLDEAVIREWLASGETVTAYAQRLGVSPQTLTARAEAYGLYTIVRKGRRV